MEVAKKEVLEQLSRELEGRVMDVNIQVLKGTKYGAVPVNPWMPDVISIKLPPDSYHVDSYSEGFVIGPGSQGYLPHDEKFRQTYSEQKSSATGEMALTTLYAQNLPVRINATHFLKIPEIAAVAKEIIARLPESDLVKDFKGSLERRMGIYT